MLMFFKRLFKSILLFCMPQSKYIDYLRKRGVGIGENCDIEKSAYFGSEPFLISMGNNVRITRNVKFITHDGGIWVLRNLNLVDNKSVKYGKIVIGNNVNIGWDSIIMPGVSIGNNCIIGAGAIVTKDIPDNSVVVGVPGRVIETVSEYYNKVHNKLVPTYGMNANELEMYLEKCGYFNVNNDINN